MMTPVQTAGSTTTPPTKWRRNLTALLTVVGILGASSLSSAHAQTIAYAVNSHHVQYADNVDHQIVLDDAGHTSTGRQLPASARSSFCPRLQPFSNILPIHRALY